MFILRKFIVFILILILISIIPYFFSPIYDFPPYHPFTGDKIYNPYKDIDSTAWKKANFHTHAKNVFGRYSPVKDIYNKIYKAYKELGYDVICISDYQNISKFDNTLYIPAYEHGWGFPKIHQGSVDAKKVLMLDYLFYESIHQKQYIINLLKNRASLVILNHPRHRDAYTEDDIKLLTNYDLIEVLNHRFFSLKDWDAALSSGHMAYIAGDDDAHDITDPYQVGVCCTFLNTKYLIKDSIINTVKSGKAFGADVQTGDNWTFADKVKQAKLIPKVNIVEVKDNKLTLQLSEVAKKIRFIGQNGIVEKTCDSTNQPYYDFKPSDTYIRTEITFFKNVVFYLNPVFRYNGKLPKYPLPTINVAKTILYRCFIAVLFLIILSLIIIINKKRKK